MHRVVSVIQTHSFKFFPLLFLVVHFPLLLHVVKKLLSIHQELSAVLLLPSFDLGLQTLLQLKNIK